MALHLQCTITLLHPYNGHIPGIFPDVHVISKTQPTYGTAQKRSTTPGGPLRPDRRRPWGPTDHSVKTLVSPGLRMSSSSNPRTHETGISALALDVGFVAPDVLSSRSFGDRPEGGVPNSLLSVALPNKKGTSWLSK